MWDNIHYIWQGTFFQYLQSEIIYWRVSKIHKLCKQAIAQLDVLCCHLYFCIFCILKIQITEKYSIVLCYRIGRGKITIIWYSWTSRLSISAASVNTYVEPCRGRGIERIWPFNFCYFLNRRNSILIEMYFVCFLKFQNKILDVTSAKVVFLDATSFDDSIIPNSIEVLNPLELKQIL